MSDLTPEVRVADALRKVAQQIEAAFSDDVRGRPVHAEDLSEAFLSIADELDPPVGWKLGEPS